MSVESEALWYTYIATISFIFHAIKTVIQLHAAQQYTTCEIQVRSLDVVYLYYVI